MKSFSITASGKMLAEFDGAGVLLFPFCTSPKQKQKKSGGTEGEKTYICHMLFLPHLFSEGYMEEGLQA